MSPPVNTYGASLNRTNPYQRRKTVAKLPADAVFPLEMWRSTVVLALLSLALAALALWAVKVQLIDNDFLQTKGDSRYAKLLEIPAPRGKIYDRNDVVVASNVPARAIWAIPEEVNMTEAQQNKLATLLGISTEEVGQKVSREDKRFVYLRRQVPQETADKIKDLKIAGIYSQKEEKRDYPQGEIFAHVTGYTNIEGQGQDGLELIKNNEIQGKSGSRKVIRDRLGNVIEDQGVITDAHPGQDIHLSLDARVQFIVYSALHEAVDYHRAKSAAAMVIDTQTGEVLALANYPSYDPNNRANMDKDNVRDRAVSDAFEPGSALKPFPIALALDKGKITPTSVINVGNGQWTIGNYTIGDHVSGDVDIATILKKSSNIGTAKISLMMPREEVWQMYDQLGFGKAYALGLPGVTKGLLRPAKSWQKIEQATMAYGQGIALSLLQLGHAYTVFARDGELIDLTLIKRDGQSPVTGQRVFSPETAKIIRNMMEGVTQRGGTAQRAQVIGYTVAGKTGTAYKPDGNGYNKNQYIATFAGLAPVSTPRIVVAVMVDNPSANGHMGGDVAAPVFSEIVSETLRTLSIAPDAPYNTSISYDAVEESM